jgi:deazaflavin-dependent oxidoreductase (nitroreductase family)
MNPPGLLGRRHDASPDYHELAHQSACLSVFPSADFSSRNPPWYHNLVTNPVVTVEVGTEKVPGESRSRSGAERQRLFDAYARLMPFLNNYQKKTKRQIPMLTLTRI